jgi:hypothetical protein
MEVFCFRFASFRLEAKRMAVFCFRFASFRFGAKIMAVFRFFFVLFLLCSIFNSLQISTFRINAKQAKKAIFSHQSEKIFASVLLHFASKRKLRRTLLRTKTRMLQWKFRRFSFHYFPNSQWRNKIRPRLNSLWFFPPQKS